MVTIHLVNLRKTFGDVIATDDVNMDLEEGKLTTLLGPSGCGKTTLLRLIAGFYIPDRGRIFFDDRDVTEIPPNKRKTGMCFQNYALWPHMTVFDNISYGLKMKRMNGMKYTPAAIANRVEKVIDLVHMQGLANRTPHQLSGGQQQRVALARALVIEPDVLLLDEPLSNLDAKLRHEMREEIMRIQKELSITTVYVTHDQNEALSISDMVAVMDKGYIQQYASPKEIYARPQTIFVADFIGKCTFIDAEITSLGEYMKARLPDGQVVSGRSPLEGYPFQVGERVRCAVRPEDLQTERTDPTDNEIMGVANEVVYLGSNLEIHFKVGDIDAVSLLPPDAPASKGDKIRLFAPRANVMVLPLGGVDALRKIPGHPLYSQPAAVSSSAA
ncbi:MAG: spermidine/putrescine ABC transporter ATP-binding protein [Candidatus Thorarchaeota archaeon]|nr:MAG: spermidine/putrescine ABC transporter ATP-binding protein [Candidatus Thorarchaeota archaeon]